MHLRAIPLTPSHVSKLANLSLFVSSTCVCVEDLTFRASEIHHNSTGAYHIMSGSPTAPGAPHSWKWISFRLEAAELLTISACNAHTSDQTHLEYY